MGPLPSHVFSNISQDTFNQYFTWKGVVADHTPPKRMAGAVESSGDGPMIAVKITKKRTARDHRILDQHLAVVTRVDLRESRVKGP